MPNYREWRGKPFKDRFDAKWILAEETGCWVWTASLTYAGYGRLGVPELGTNLAHRIGWMLYRGPIPEGLVIDHMCRVRCCVNPDHLRVVTKRINSTENSRSVWALNAKKTHCPKGHPYQGPNLIRLAKSRACRICTKRQDQLTNLKRRGIPRGRYQSAKKKAQG